MKSKILMAILASAALVASAQAGHHSSNGGNSVAAPSRGGGPSYRSAAMGRFGSNTSFRSMPVRSFNGNRMIYSGQGYSAMRSPTSGNFRSSNSQPSYAGNRSVASSNRQTGNQFRNGSAQYRNGNQTLRSDWRNHVFAHESANSHRDWNRGRGHWWHGHQWFFIGGSWFAFDAGFYPWWPWWWDWYPYDYYGDGYYGYPGYGYGYQYDYGNGYNYDQPTPYENGSVGRGYSLDTPSADQTVAAAQGRLARDGYYRGRIDGVLGQQTRAALAQYQSNHGLRITGSLTPETVRTLGLRRVASY